MKEKVRVSAVSYTNTLPFVYGLENAGLESRIELSLDVPGVCADKMIRKQADVGIVPVAALLDIPGYEIISDYCLGASGPVDSVFIFSRKPIMEIASLRLDDQSRTSNGLARILLTEFWKREDVQIVREGDADAFVQIGDRTFGQKSQHPYSYDLAQYWAELTGLPFVFAVWISVHPLPVGFVDDFNAALRFGLDNRDKVIARIPQRPDFDYARYLTENIDYHLDQGKKEAMKRYLSWLRAETP